MTAIASFGQWLKQRRKALDMTQEALAGCISCTTNLIYKMEADVRRPSRQIAQLLAENLNIPHDEHITFVAFARGETSEHTAPWGTPFHPPNNLHAQPTEFIGRNEDVTTARKRLLQPETHLLTLLGPPGIGKTRLALQVAFEVLGDFADGVFFVALASITDASLVIKTIATTLDLQEVGPQPPLARLTAFLRHKQTLLVLDNFEQILAAAPQIAELLAACSSLKVLVTSRAPLRIRQERQLPVPPLALPDLARLPDVESVTHYSAVALFLERAQAVKPDFLLTEENASTVAAICIRLDGLPLAIELISARMKLLPPAALLERLHGRLMLQSDGLRDIEPRHRTLNAAIDWSYQLLNTEEQTLFWRLGVFVGGWTLEAAEVVCTENLKLNLIDGMASLLDKNLVKQDLQFDGEPRFMMLETIREYALERLVVSGELASLQQRHADYFLKLTEQMEAHLFGREQIIWFDRVEVEIDNLRAALARSAESETGLRLAASLGWFFSERFLGSEGLSWLEQMMAGNPEAPASLRAKALHSAGSLAGIRGDMQGAQVYCEQALAIAGTIHDDWNIAWSLSHLGNFGSFNLNLSAARLEESVALFRQLDDPMGLTHALVRLSWNALRRKDFAYAHNLIDEAAILANQVGDTIMLGWANNAMGTIVRQSDNLERAKFHYEHSILLFQHARFSLGLQDSFWYLADLELAMGNLVRAQNLFKEVLILHKGKLHTDWSGPENLVKLATIARLQGQFERAARLLAAANVGWGGSPHRPTPNSTLMKML